MRPKALPHGPLLLRDIGFDNDVMGAAAHDDHKLTVIRDVLDRYPKLPFVLIGDNGENDPETYATIVDEYPGRIRAVWIHDVVEGSGDAKRSRLTETLGDESVDGLLMIDLADAARQAARLGLIDRSEVSAADAAVARDGVAEGLAEPTDA